jgi:hypothetical protein
MKTEMIDIILKGLFMGVKVMKEEQDKCGFGKRSVYQYWSFDFHFDADSLKPYLIEINRTPAYDAANKYEFYCRHAVDMLNLVGYTVDELKNNSNNSTNHDTLYEMNGMKKKMMDFGMKLTTLDVRELVDGEDELNRMNRYFLVELEDAQGNNSFLTRG